jgi:hypothetical protein
MSKSADHIDQKTGHLPIWTGVWQFLFGLFPSWPISFHPQAQSVSFFLITAVCSPSADPDFQLASVRVWTDVFVSMFVPVDPFFQLVSGAAAGHVLKGLYERAFRT